MAKPFNGRLLTLARQMRRMSQTELVNLLGGTVSQGTLSKVEHGRIQPGEELVELLAGALKVRSSFFYDSGFIRDPVVSYHRKRSKLGVRHLDSVHAQAEVIRLNLRKCLEALDLEARLPLPAIDPDEFGRDPDEIARAVRQRWGVPRGPIDDVTKLAEDAGIIVITLDFGSELIDGFCQYAADGVPPLVFLNAAQPKDRLRFSLAHEVGHLVMHHTPHPQQEVEANRFASEFLMPSREIKPDFDGHSLTRFMDLKVYWGVSMQALMYKAWQTGKLTDRMYKYYVIEMSKRGFRKREPVDVPHLKETPSTLKQIIRAHIEDLDYSIDDLGEMFGLLDDDVTGIYPVPAARPKLRLVRNA
ncbi:ImmA/IrrE family metallo-endopeptidase [Sphingomonas ginsenosidivorax]|uniref:ImmA/IrrE family metallo-endopeptidase n=1 Tax=Sphingomonas ginsenosidivorax TaxID=862135 RepID=A0A5C6UDV3_9SPHN|nr:XRE family transcriptional regulator [Sphingomonas ginsenosidivorax]TXC70967.1 ImmA/IrrE family metallo-endopeptidase [Sphingomonas ginsenosidivorax]